MLSDERKEWISDLAQYIAKCYFNKYEPILPELIAKHRKVTYCYGNYGIFFDGMLEHINGKFHIYVNTEKHNNPQRHRFTFAHELGHFFIDEHALALSQNLSAGHCSITGFISENEVEREADLFAASLLMPESWVLEIYRQNRVFSFSIIDTISKKFQVSLLSTLYRIFYLDLHPLMIVKVVSGKIIGNPQRSRDFYFYLKDKSLPDDSGPLHYFKDKRKFNTRELYAFDWFNTESTKPIFEHCLYLESIDTVIAIIWYK